MTERPSYSTSPPALVVALTALLGGGAAPGAAQSEPVPVCDAAVAPLECHLAAAAVEVIQPRVGLALWGGNPVPGTASTAGFRIGRTPRISVSGRVTLVPTTVPPLLDRTRSRSSTAAVASASIQSSVGVLHGFSPLPTVGGVLSLDAIGRVSVGRLPAGKGFADGAVWGWSAGLRLGLLRESFTLPGVSLTATYGHSTRVTLGDPDRLGSDGFIRGSVSGIEATAAVSRRLLGFRVAGGLSWARYGSDARLSYDGAPAAPSLGTLEGEFGMPRWSGFGSIAWSPLIYDVVLELGWQETPTLPTLPADVDIDPAGWWVDLGFRVTP